MINANELRIGNWVYDFGRKPVQIIRITKDKIPLEQPIPLTLEILEKCGFEKYSNPNHTPSTIFNFNDFKIIKNNGFKTFYFREYRSVGFKYLHQLQNLYFALTGEELKINLNVEALQR